MRFDAIVLGAGVVGVSAALHLQTRGLAVVLVDRRGPGEETSFGNAGVIERSALLPVAFPRDIGLLLRIALRRAPQANYRLADLPALLPWLWSYFRQGTPERLEASALALHPLVDRSLAEHEALMAAAGAKRYLRRNGWLRVSRSEKTFVEEAGEFDLADRLGIPYEVHDTDGALRLEPHLAPVFAKAVLWPTTASVSDPGAVVRAYADLFAAEGGAIRIGHAKNLARSSAGWRVDTAEGPVSAERAVAALGPWTPDLLTRLGIRLPFAVKRGYHMHFRARGDAGLGRPVVDVEAGYALAPMARGIRLTTGIEFAAHAAPASRVQLDRVLPYARALLPGLGEPIDDRPWMGARPCLPDSLPVIGPAPGQPGLHLAFGHQHLGFTLGPVTGRLLAETMTGQAPVVDPHPYRAERFGGAGRA